MTDALDTKIRAFLVEIIDAVPSPPEFDAIEHTRVATMSRTTRSRAHARSSLVAVGVILSVVAAIGVAVAITDDGRTDRVPAADSTTQATAPDLQADECIVKSTGVLGCAATPEQAAPQFGAVPRTPSQLPDGWALVRQDLRIYQTDEPALSGTGYFQLWTPNGEQPDPSGNYARSLQLRQRLQQPNEAPPACDGSTSNRARQVLANGTQACVTTVGGPTNSDPDKYTAEWLHDGISFILEGGGATRAQFEETMNSIS